MKSFSNSSLLIVSLLFVSNLFFSSCHKENNDPKTTPIPLLASAHFFIGNDVLDYSESYQYDTQGRLMKITEDDGCYTTVEYVGSTVILRSYNADGLYETSVWKLNSQGLRTSLTHEESDYVEKYEYDNDGFVKTIFDENESGFTTVTFTVSEGNYVTQIQEFKSKTTNSAIAKKLGFHKSNLISTNPRIRLATENRLKSAALHIITKVDCQFYKDKMNTIEYENMGASFMGKQSRNPIKQEIYTHNRGTQAESTRTYTYTYEYDDKGRITKQISDLGNYSVYTYID